MALAQACQGWGIGAETLLVFPPDDLNAPFLSIVNCFDLTTLMLTSMEGCWLASCMTYWHGITLG